MMLKGEEGPRNTGFYCRYLQCERFNTFGIIARDNANEIRSAHQLEA